MKEIIFGTTNPGKIAHVQAALDPLGVKVLNLSGYDSLPEIEEDGQTPEENACKKAVAYCQAIGQPVLSMDNALYLDDIDKSLQPGMHVRRIPGHAGRPTDEEVLKYYADLIREHGGRMTGQWKFAICLAFPNGTIKRVTAISKIRHFTDKISSRRMEGYPLESIQIDAASGKYIAEMTKEESDKIWQESVGKELQKLFSEI